MCLDVWHVSVTNTDRMFDFIMLVIIAWLYVIMLVIMLVIIM